MRRANHSAMAAWVGLAFLTGAACAFAQDWPQWRGPDRDGKVEGFTAPQQWPTALIRKWAVTAGAGDSTPALVGDRLYVFTRQDTEEVVLCLDADTGDELWRNSYAAQTVTGAASRHPGPRSSPAVVDGKVVTLGVGGVLSCLKAATGKVVWRNEEYSGAVPRFFTAMSPIIVDGMAVAHLGGPNDGAVVAFDLTTGEQKWKWSGDAPAYASPVLMTVQGTKQIVVLTAKQLVGIGAADGKLLWQVAAVPQRRTYNSATPIVIGQTVVYTGQDSGTRAVEIQREGDGFAVKELWTNPDLGTGFSTPVVKDGLLFGLSTGGNLFCLNARTGETVWVDPATRRQNFGSLLDAGSVIFALPSDSELIAFKPSDKGYEELARIKIADQSTYAHPVIAGNRIYVRDQMTVAMLTIE